MTPVDQEQAVPQGAPHPALRIDMVTIFPKMFEALLGEGVLARAVTQKKLDVRVWDLREFATDRHRSTDDEAYGGGAGMVMLAEPLFACLDAIRRTNSEQAPWVVLLSPQGGQFGQKRAVELAAAKWIVLLCGRYEGIDERVRLSVVNEEISIGDFVVTGGELPAMLIADAVARFIPGVVGNSDSVHNDSFSDGLLDYPHYTRPAEIRGLRVPDVLLSGHAEKIRKWRRLESLRSTWIKRPDLLERVTLDAEGKKLLSEITDRDES